mgnify:CR=1 FL=1
MNLGVDVNAVDDLDPLFTPVSGRLAHAQAIARRLGTQRGTLAHIGESSDYGYDLRELLNEDTGARATFEIASNVEREALKDERTQSARAIVTLVSGRMTVLLDLFDADGPFTLTLAASAVTVELLKVQ